MALQSGLVLYLITGRLSQNSFIISVLPGHKAQKHASSLLNLGETCEIVCRQDPAVQACEERRGDSQLQGDGEDVLLRERVQLREEHGDLPQVHRGSRR